MGAVGVEGTGGGGGTRASAGAGGGGGEEAGDGGATCAACTVVVEAAAVEAAAVEAAELLLATEGGGALQAALLGDTGSEGEVGWDCDQVPRQRTLHTGSHCQGRDGTRNATQRNATQRNTQGKTQGKGKENACVRAGGEGRNQQRPATRRTSIPIEDTSSTPVEGSASSIAVASVRSQCTKMPCGIAHTEAPRHGHNTHEATQDARPRQLRTLLVSAGHTTKYFLSGHKMTWVSANPDKNTHT